MNKVAKTLLISFAVLLVCGIAGFVIVLNVTGESNKSGAQSIDDIVAHSYETPDITTDLEDGSFVRIQFQIITDGKEAKEEISKRDFQLKNILIKELAKMDEEAFKSGLSDLEKTIQEKLNEVMTDGKIIDVYTINKVLQ